MDEDALSGGGPTAGSKPKWRNTYIGIAHV